MEQEPIENKKTATFKDYTMFTLGALFMIISCLFFVGAIVLDIVGEEAIGKLSNAATGNCPPNKTCWTGKMEFTTKDGEQVAFYPMTFPMLFDFDPWLSGRSYEEYGNYQVRYLAQYPKIAKVKLAYFLEYANTACGFCAGIFIFLLAYLFSSFGKSRKPIVLDLSKGNK